MSGKKTPPKKIRLDVTPAELSLLLESLDSHRYWNLSDEQYRNDGYVLEPGSDDEDNARDIRAVDRLEEKLEKLTAKMPVCCDSPECTHGED